MVRFLKELYLAEFASYYRASQQAWSHHYNAGKGVAGVSFFTFLILAGVEIWIEIFMGKQLLSLYLAHWYGYIATFLVFLLNYYVLVIRGYGIRYEHDFNELPQAKRKVLRISCWAMEITSVVFIIWSICAYRHVFHIVPRY